MANRNRHTIRDRMARQRNKFAEYNDWDEDDELEEWDEEDWDDEEDEDYIPISRRQRSTNSVSGDFDSVWGQLEDEELDDEYQGLSAGEQQALNAAENRYREHHSPRRRKNIDRRMALSREAQAREGGKSRRMYQLAGMDAPNDQFETIRSRVMGGKIKKSRNDFDVALDRLDGIADSYNEDPEYFKELLTDIQIRPGVYYSNLPLDDQWTIMEPAQEMDLDEYMELMDGEFRAEPAGNLLISDSECVVAKADGDFCGAEPDIICQNPRTKNSYTICEEHASLIARNHRVKMLALEDEDEDDEDEEELENGLNRAILEFDSPLDTSRQRNKSLRSDTRPVRKSQEDTGEVSKLRGIFDDVVESLYRR